MPNLDNAFIRFNARLLDPTTAGKLGDVAPRPTAYVSNRLLVAAVTPLDSDNALAAIDAAAGLSGLRRTHPWGAFDEFEQVPTRYGEPLDAAEIRAHRVRVARRRRLLELGGIPVIRVELESTDNSAAPPPVDVFDVLRRLRAAGQHTVRRDPSIEADHPAHQAWGYSSTVGLDHLMFSSAFIQGNPAVPHGTSVGILGDPAVPHGTGFTDWTYQSPGFGGRMPVAVTLPAPTPTGAGRPHVITLDTGIGAHGWFSAPNEAVNAVLTLTDGTCVAQDCRLPAVAKTSPDGHGAVPDEMTGALGSHAGHGTFISGLLRQTCPDALLSTLRIMDVDGVVPESALTDALDLLITRQFDGGGAGEPGRMDALVLSLGYYAEVDDADYTAGLEGQLLRLACDQVRIFAAAGNDCTDRRSFPAGFADHDGFRDRDSALHAVRALNPDGLTVALFSNDGDWVNDGAVGANVVSTLPDHMAASGQPVVETAAGPHQLARATPDPDGYGSGFGLWSGTSFAAPIAAGRYLAKHLADYQTAEMPEIGLDVAE